MYSWLWLDRFAGCGSNNHTGAWYQEVCGQFPGQKKGKFEMKEVITQLCGGKMLNHHEFVDQKFKHERRGWDTRKGTKRVHSKNCQRCIQERTKNG